MLIIVSRITAGINQLPATSVNVELARLARVSLLNQSPDKSPAMSTPSRHCKETWQEGVLEKHVVNFGLGLQRLFCSVKVFCYLSN